VTPSTLVAAVCCLTFLFSAAPASADWPAAAGTTVIEGDRTGFAFVRLPQPVEVPMSEDEWGLGVELSGSGRFYGFALREESPSRDERVMVYGTHGDGDGFQMDRAFPEGPPAPGDEEKGVFTLPAGLYRLYVFADGAPVRAEIGFPGLDGTATFAPEVPVPHVLMDLPRVNSAGPVLYTFAGASTLRTEGLAAVRMHVQSDSQVTEYETLCMYGPGDEYDETTAFGPGCGDPVWAAEDVVFTIPPWMYVPPDHDEWGWEAVEARAEPGEWAVGGTIRTVQGSGTNEMFGIWIDYEPAPGTPLPERPADPAPPPPEPPPPPPAAPAAAPPAPPAAAPAPKRAKKKSTRRRACRVRRGASAKRRRAARRACKRRRAAAVRRSRRG
jgi:hypothetical protein